MRIMRKSAHRLVTVVWGTVMPESKPRGCFLENHLRRPDRVWDEALLLTRVVVHFDGVFRIFCYKKRGNRRKPEADFGMRSV